MSHLITKSKLNGFEGTGKGHAPYIRPLCRGWFVPNMVIILDTMKQALMKASVYLFYKWWPDGLDGATGFYTKGRPLVKSNLIGPSDKLSWQPGCPVLNVNIQGNFCISLGNGFSDNLPENLV